MDGSNETEPEVVETTNGHPHYADLSDISKYEHNRQPILYPLRRDPQQAEAWANRLKGAYSNIPSQCIPKYSEDRRCHHGNRFDPCDSSLGIRSKGLGMA